MSLNFRLLSHRNGNIGHAFMAYGLEYAIRKAFDGEEIYLSDIEQHRPFDLYPPLHPLRILNFIPAGHFSCIKKLVLNPLIEKFLLKTVDSKIKCVNAVISCGGPAVVHDAWRSPEMHFTLHHMHAAFAQYGIPVAVFALGACVPYEKSENYHFSEQDKLFFKKIFKYSKVVTVRDKLAESIFQDIGFKCPLIPCSSLLSSLCFEKTLLNTNKVNDGFIVINFQEKGANEDWGQEVDSKKWGIIMSELISRLEKRHRIIFICHNEKEYELAGKFQRQSRYLPKTVEEYFKVINGAKVGLCNRIHAAMPLASIGVPSVGVGTDTRLKTLETIGLPVFYVKNATADLLENQMEQLVGRRKSEAERLKGLRDFTLQQYIELLKQLEYFPIPKCPLKTGLSGEHFLW